MAEITSSTSFFASQSKEESCYMTNSYGHTFESFVSLGADVLMPYFELPTGTHIFSGLLPLELQYRQIFVHLKHVILSICPALNLFFFCNCSIILHIFFYMTLLTKEFF
jgi:hypothetical protein